MNTTIELQRAYRALQAFYRAEIAGKPLPAVTIAYHSAPIAAALRFVDSGALDGAEYFEGKPVAVLHDALKLAQPRTPHATTEGGE